MHTRSRALVYVVDTPEMADLCREVLHQYCGSVSVETFSNAEDAVSALSKASLRPQVICASLVSMHGLQLAEDIKHIDPSVRVLLMSGLALENIVDELAAANVLPDSVLPKPFTAQDFSTKIMSLIE